jgi:galactokinase
MYETHYGLSKEYEVSCEELDFLNEIAKECSVTGSRIMGGGFGGCSINLNPEALHDEFISKAKDAFKDKFGHYPEVYEIIIGDGAKKLQ